MKNITLLLVLMLYSLILAGDISAKSKIVLTGKMIFNKEKQEINFYLEDYLDGNYSLVLIHKNQFHADFLIEEGMIIHNVLKQRVWSKIKPAQLIKKDDINYLIINISNTEVAHMNHLEILFLGIKTIFHIEKKTKSVIDAKLE